MGGHGKSKRNKNKGKSKKYSKPNNEKLLDQGHEKQIGETSSTSGAKETTADHEENISPISERYCDCMLEDVLFKKVQILYMKVEIKLLELGYKPEETRRAILLNGSICGKENIFRNILLNTLVMIKKERRDGINGFEPVYKDVAELARFSANALMNMIRQDHPSLSEKEVSRFVLECGLLEEYDEHHDDDDNDLAEGLKNASVTDVGKVLMETTLYLQRLRISPPPAPEQEQTVDEDHELSSGELFESDIVDSQDKINLKEWLKFCSESSKDNMSSEFVEQIEYLTRQVKERKEWAQRVVNQAYQRFKETRAELRNLKLWKLESLVKENEQVDRMNSMINERENALRTLMTYLNSTIAPKKRFEAKNAVINADIAAYDLNTNENIKFLLEAQKKEKRTLTKCNDTRKKVDDLNAQIEEMKQKIAETAHKMQQVNDSQEQAKVLL
ncbi:hypothetical protein M9H77_30506 [Catharanthus roseus]|uniref:Uncharacterized protein n=1 Tax=Catharanthus roseus TaxID=4058 RepID=A0ACB9ZXS6_CATRO|nr:hypothetical protein M9H77_30506 [Catharanthus roseus]